MGVVGLLFIGLVCFSLAPRFHGFTSKEPPGYYGLLTEAFRIGQLHLPLEIDPKLLSLENPYDGPQGATRPHDMSFYKGKLYLYYGPAPVILLYLPWRLLTGNFLAESVGSMVLLGVGFMAASFWLTRLKRAHLPHLSSWWLALALFALLTSTPILEAIINDTFYGVPIHGAFACIMLALLALDSALRTSSSRAQVLWLSLSSFAWGMAVGSRPIYVVSLLALGGAALWLMWQARKAGRRGLLKILTAAVLPASVIGVTLAAYNYYRFDSPIDFGIRFSMATADLREARLVGPEFIAKNIRLYLFRPGEYLRYAPFFYSADQAVGMLLYLPILWIAALLPLTWSLHRLRTQRWVLGTSVAAGSGVANLALLCLFFGGEARYLLDFTPPIMIGALAAMMALAESATRPSRGKAYRWSGIIACLLVGFGAFHGIAVGLQGLPDSLAKNRVLRVLNGPVAWWEGKQDAPLHGPLLLEVRFPEGTKDVTEPLLVTGRLGGNGDLVTVTYLGENQVEFGYFHRGSGGPSSLPVKIDPTHVYRLEIHAGGLQPPPEHPVFADWPEAEVARLRRQLLIKLDDEVVLRGKATSYPSTPDTVQIGANDLALDVAVSRFSGEILSREQLGVSRAAADPWTQGDGPVELEVILPSRPTVTGVPLISTGRPGHGDLVLAEVLEGSRVRFGHDSWGAGLVWTEAVAFDPAQTQKIHIELGSLYDPSKLEDNQSAPNRWLVALNGETVFSRPRPFHPSLPGEIEFGYNTVQSSAAMPGFIGTLIGVKRVAPVPDALDEGEAWGAIRLSVKFPPDRSGRAEPLVVTGSPGRADVIYVQYGNQQVRFGHDHWSVGASIGEWIPFDFTIPHRIEIDSASLHPPGSTNPENPAVPRATVVRLDGVEVLRSSFVAYEASDADLAIGANTIGASSCAQDFGGEFFLRERVPELPPLKP